jgi:pimeloyl-ACP methyl ester carboxylesterase
LFAVVDMQSAPSQASASDADRFNASPARFQDVGSAEINYRVFGAGPPVLFLHGWPLSGFTYRKVLPALATRFACYVVDLPGAGDTRWRDGTDFSFSGQAETLRRLLDALALSDVHVVAHDTGGTIARALALLGGGRLGKMVLIGTEIPGHRPPWIPLFQRLAGLPGARASFRLLLSSERFLHSPLAFGNCFVDKRLLRGEFREHFIRPLCASTHRLEGQLRYLRGIDWALVDRLGEDHRRITNPVLLLWGEKDTIFPPARARIIAEQLADCRGFEVVSGAKLLVHEEQPAAVAERVLRFFEH